MAHIIAELTARILERMAETKNPCKLYASEAAADKAGAAMADATGHYFTMQGKQHRPARYVVFQVPGSAALCNRTADVWVYCIDMTELLQRSTSTGGYLGFAKDSFNY